MLLLLQALLVLQVLLVLFANARANASKVLLGAASCWE